MPGKDWPELPVFTMRLFCFVIFGAFIALATPLAMADMGIAAAFFLWNLLRTRKELPGIIHQAPPHRHHGGGRDERGAGPQGIETFRRYSPDRARLIQNANGR